MLKASRREIPTIFLRIQTQLTENSLNAKRYLHSTNVATKINEECGEHDDDCNVVERKVVNSSITCSIIQRRDKDKTEDR